MSTEEYVISENYDFANDSDYKRLLIDIAAFRVPVRNKDLHSWYIAKHNSSN